MGSERELRRAEPRPGDIIAGKYKVEALLGRGAMGSVYAARNQGTGKRLALKWLLTERQADMEMIARFEREARAAGRIDHPNVVSVYDVGRDGASSFLVMELLRGYSLYKLMQQGPLPPEVAVQLIMPVLRGIGAAHDAQVIHRDLKPGNVFVCLGPDDRPRNTKILDFGVSKMTDEMREGLSVTQTGVIIGTPYYMAPEQVRGITDIDHRIDIYAAGVILYEMIAGRPPFVAENYSGLVLEVATGTPPDLRELAPGIDEGIVEIIARAMARDREARFQDARSFGEALEPFAGGVTFALRHAEWSQKIKLPRTSNPPPPMPKVMTDSYAETLASVDVDLAASGERRSSIVDPDEEISAEPETTPREESAADDPNAAWHESVGSPSASRAPKRRLMTATVVAVVLALVVGTALALTLGEGDEATPPDLRGGDEGAAAAESETSGEVGDPAAGGEPTPEPLDVVAAEPDPGEPRASAEEATEEREGEAEEPAMARRRPRARSARMSMAPSAVMAEPQGTARMDSHRAGSLSLEDF